MNLPPEIVQDLYPHTQDLRLSMNTSSISSIPDPNQNNNNNETLFDESVGKIVNIIGSYDMGWNKRGNGKSYDSLNGYGTIIGFLTGKILDYTTRNPKCAKCDAGQPKNNHDC
ncbi:hypothetical protein TSAR_007574 [Trichomalopsis sarcophagae]|uniref:Mutator-like transposase domain-containing protein n=1 Tax=Trichomalopsis sarcophagae TaxID=543379 RepID=A0A232ESE9_9HYME|nr:hypothetical protein TSAR_007574 [Trichomalopsis sarcophagae]